MTLLTLGKGGKELAFNQPVIDDIDSCADHKQSAPAFNIGQDGPELANYSTPEYSDA